ncbi:MAG: hypothetical protein ACYTXY_46755, partial [Nostoc sp.]
SELVEVWTLLCVVANSIRLIVFKYPVKDAHRESVFQPAIASEIFANLLWKNPLVPIFLKCVCSLSV